MKLYPGGTDVTWNQMRSAVKLLEVFVGGDGRPCIGPFREVDGRRTSCTLHGPQLAKALDVDVHGDCAYRRAYRLLVEIGFDKTGAPQPEPREEIAYGGLDDLREIVSVAADGFSWLRDRLSGPRKP